ncbi:MULTISPECIES: TRAP transporter small permease subunit [Halomonadaceae]|jgi:TRAP-type mannitol/chloroaromatic compound transport system permease small subunit|uniref:TRAP transporter small permease subunit n=1 Tax=Halomonadaceae TaxID=28256 RepID=UPI001581D9C5|nr:MULTISPECIES: TRAP transporter small permease [Halomonas]MDI4638634.1 TRAP transporter small permease [Halomonas sp. BMC7]NUJ59620.1 TRAP transporter small permease [Halomonas taeanensis]|tara:strand:+ start:14407 stop:14982 length:576 start_codon:yes stop_codon:yes gene_type:complete
MKTLIPALDAVVGVTRLISRIAARLMGFALLAVVLFIGVEILMRQFAGHALSGVHEYSGYVLAVLSAWGLSHTLLERAHIRIDVVHGQLSPRSRQALDIIALLALNLVAWTIAFNAYPVLAKSLANSSTANTPLATPLWIPQVLWLAGYVWFAITTSVLGLRVLAALLTHDAATIEALAGPDKGETAQETT